VPCGLLLLLWCVERLLTVLLCFWRQRHLSARGWAVTLLLLLLLLLA
jgi:hypothetical protein